jgi:hypothetical protein
MRPPSSDARASFETWCVYRALYRRRGPMDTEGAMTVDAAIRYAETMLVFSRPSVVIRADRSADSTV